LEKAEELLEAVVIQVLWLWGKAAGL